MTKRFLTLLLILPLLFCCKGNKENPTDNTGTTDPTDPEGFVVVDKALDGEAWADAAPQIRHGQTYRANSEITEKYLNEVNYPDKDLSFTKIFDYEGWGYDGKTYHWVEKSSGSYTYEPTPWPDGDKPASYSIRWETGEDANSGLITVHLEDKLDWKANIDVKSGSAYVNITSLVPNDEYTYSAVAGNGKILAQGTFKTSGNLHQVFFKTKCRNARDLGGWTTTDGKKIKYRKVYRGGRMNDPWETMLNKEGKQEVLMEGIGAELELRGSDDLVKKPAVDGLDHCVPIIEEGGKVMLGVHKPSNYNCAKWLKFDVKREDMVNMTKEKLKEYVPTAKELEDFQDAYKAKTKQCFEFVLNSVKAGKGCYFHCSLGRDRTGTMAVLIMGILGVREGDISKEYELTYFAPMGFSVSSSDYQSNPQLKFQNTREHWVYSDIVPYFWGLSTDGTFKSGVEKYLNEIAGVPMEEITEFRNLMLE